MKLLFVALVLILGSISHAGPGNIGSAGKPAQASGSNTRTMRLDADKLRIVSVTDAGSTDDMSSRSRNLKFVFKMLADNSLETIIFPVDGINVNDYAAEASNVNAALKMGESVELRYSPNTIGSLQFKFAGPDVNTRVYRLRSSKVRIIESGDGGQADDMTSRLRNFQLKIKFLEDGSIGYIVFPIDAINTRHYQVEAQNMATTLRLGSDVALTVNPYSIGSARFDVLEPEKTETQIRSCQDIFL